MRHQISRLKSKSMAHRNAVMRCDAFPWRQTPLEREVAAKSTYEERDVRASWRKQLDQFLP
jgi:hypothetical protein